MFIIAWEVQISLSEIYEETEVRFSLLQNKLFCLLVDSFHWFIFVFLYQLICLSDLEFDYINPYDSASRVNAVVIIEYALQGVLCASFFLTLNWFPFLVMAPVTYYHVKLYVLLSLSPQVYPANHTCLFGHFPIVLLLLMWISWYLTLVVLLWRNLYCHYMIEEFHYT